VGLWAIHQYKQVAVDWEPIFFSAVYHPAGVAEN
jgi:hypothetical protein